jgi:hypothetical protein
MKSFLPSAIPVLTASLQIMPIAGLRIPSWLAPKSRSRYSFSHGVLRMFGYSGPDLRPGKSYK